MNVLNQILIFVENKGYTDHETIIEAKKYN